MTTSDRSVAKATLLVIVSACCFGSLTTIVLLTSRAGLPLAAAMFWRYLLGALTLFVLMKLAPPAQITRRQALRLVLIGGLAQATITYLSLLALDYIPVGPLAFLFYTYPAWLAAISAARGKEPLTLMRIVALVIAMAGIVVMVGTPSAGSLNPIGVTLALGTAILYALYLPSVASAQEGIPALTATFYLVAGVAASFFIAGLVTGELQVPGTLELWGYVAMLSLICTVMAFGALMAGLKVLGPVTTGIVATVEPFFTSLLGAVFLGDQFGLEVLAGGALIAGAVILLQRQGATPLKQSPVSVFPAPLRSRDSEYRSD